jgi:hydroxymethylpyrimidine/phosphomethylpyrimidine kinase
VTARPDLLICAGLDPSGGAGLIADVRVVSELGCRPVGVVTALTVQNTHVVVSSEPVSDEVVCEQLELLLSDVEVRAVKIGMIGSTAVARAIGLGLALTRAPVVWDPITQPSRSAVQFVDHLFGEAVAALAPHLALITPNAGELARLTGAPITCVADAAAAGQALARRLATAVLVKGGHLGGAASIDVLCQAGGVEELRGPRIPDGEHVHGTGCALSSAIAAGLAHGETLIEACRSAKAYVARRIAAPARPGRGAPAIV